MPGRPQRYGAARNRPVGVPALAGIHQKHRLKAGLQQAEDSMVDDQRESAGLLLSNVVGRPLPVLAIL